MTYRQVWGRISPGIQWTWSQSHDMCISVGLNYLNYSTIRVCHIFADCVPVHIFEMVAKYLSFKFKQLLAFQILQNLEQMLG